MTSADDHRWPVCARNMATGAVRTWFHQPRPVYFGWSLSMCMYTFIGLTVIASVPGLIAWEVFWALVWAAVWCFFALSAGQAGQNGS